VSSSYDFVSSGAHWHWSRHPLPRSRLTSSCGSIDALPRLQVELDGRERSTAKLTVCNTRDTRESPSGAARAMAIAASQIARPDQLRSSLVGPKNADPADRCGKGPATSTRTQKRKVFTSTPKRFHKPHGRARRSAYTARGRQADDGRGANTARLTPIEAVRHRLPQGPLRVLAAREHVSCTEGLRARRPFPLGCRTRTSRSQCRCARWRGGRALSIPSRHSRRSFPLIRRQR